MDDVSKMSDEERAKVVIVSAVLSPGQTIAKAIDEPPAPEGVPSSPRKPLPTLSAYARP